MWIDPVTSNPGLYSVIFENERVRVLEYLDQPGQESIPHDHPDSVMVTLSSFSRRLASGDKAVDVEMPASTARWLGAQNHSGHNTGSTPTHCIFVELKEPPLAPRTGEPVLGPTAS
ncbi:MAG: cytoplasmic protein [Rhodoglobus sp.]|nr:cytoplasmic protein [Rhodoglobus sp.]